MKLSRLTALAVTSVLAVTFMSCLRSDRPRIETSAPVVAMLKAAKNADATMFREAYSKRIRQEDQQADWGKNLHEAQTTLKETFGDYQLGDFTYSFEGNDLQGKLAISFKGKKQFAIAIIKEEGAWKLDER
jgi:hypothetical protein